MPTFNVPIQEHQWVSILLTPELRKSGYLRSAEHRGLPAAPSSFRVVVIDTGEDLGCWQSAAELRACLAFSRLSLEDVEVCSDVPVMNGITAWT